MNRKARLIAINLPQFHPFRENDEWWGKGFTEWTNVAKARPRFRNHYQPHIPADMGFYDLRLEQSRLDQASLARKYGIYGFCYYHYWFNGKILMHEPLDAILSSGKPDFPFMYCWANENWARNWDGGFKELLIEQTYSKEDHLEHINYLCKNVFSDSRYIKIYGKPVFAIYRADLIPNIKEFLQLWRDVALSKYNIELYIICVKRHISCSDALRIGFDASMDFQPLNQDGFRNYYWRSIPFKIYRRLFRKFENPFPNIIKYDSYVDFKINNLDFSDKCYPCTTPNWDNSPRRVNKSFMAFYGSTPSKFHEWVKAIINKFRPFTEEENFIFINAWNEWAEGNHLEPDLKNGLGYLEAIKKCLD